MRHSRYEFVLKTAGSRKEDAICDGIYDRNWRYNFHLFSYLGTNSFERGIEIARNVPTENAVKNADCFERREEEEEEEEGKSCFAARWTRDRRVWEFFRDEWGLRHARGAGWGTVVASWQPVSMHRFRKDLRRSRFPLASTWPWIVFTNLYYSPPWSQTRIENPPPPPPSFIRDYSYSSISGLGLLTETNRRAYQRDAANFHCLIWCNCRIAYFYWNTFI